MNPEEARELLADYLGGELDAVQRRRFEAYLAEDSALAAEAEGLRRTLEAMRTLDEPAAVSVTPTRGVTPARRRPLAFLRYAAVIVFAFGAGYVSRQVASDRTENPAAPGVVQPALPVSEPPATKGAGHGWETRAAMAWAEQTGRSGLARSLVALAQAARQP